MDIQTLLMMAVLVVAAAFTSAGPAKSQICAHDGAVCQVVQVVVR